MLFNTAEIIDKMNDASLLPPLLKKSLKMQDSVRGHLCDLQAIRPFIASKN